MSKELNHFGVIAGLFRQIGGHSSRFVLFCSFLRLFTIKMIKSIKVFPFYFWKIITIFFFYFIKFKPPAQTWKWPPSDLTLACPNLRFCFTKRIHQRTFLEELWSQEYVIVILIRANVISPVIFLSYHTNTCICIPSV